MTKGENFVLAGGSEEQVELLNCLVQYTMLLSIVVTRVVVRSATSQEAQPVEELSSHRLISDYDGLFMRVGEHYGIDWRLLAAIARAESKFRPDVVSKAGAVGLMQIMPYVARRMGVEREGLFDAEVSVTLAARLLKENDDMLRLGRNFDSEERLRFVLACYNAGFSRIDDARRLARHYEDDADKWSIVATYLALLAEEEFYEHEVVESGAFHGSEETVAYVRVVMRHYKRFCRKTER